MIKLIRLRNGEDIVAEITENETTVSIDSPAILMPMHNNGGQMQMGFGPWIPFAKSAKVSVDLPRDFILFITDPSAEIEDNYRQSFGSGLVVPSPTTKQLLT